LFYNHITPQYARVHMKFTKLADETVASNTYMYLCKYISIPVHMEFTKRVDIIYIPVHMKFRKLVDETVASKPDLQVH
jgi:hypothetical protein